MPSAISEHLHQHVAAAVDHFSVTLEIRSRVHIPGHLRVIRNNDDKILRNRAPLIFTWGTFTWDLIVMNDDKIPRNRAPRLRVTFTWDLIVIVAGRVLTARLLALAA